MHYILTQLSYYHIPVLYVVSMRVTDTAVVPAVKTHPIVPLPTSAFAVQLTLCLTTFTQPLMMNSRLSGSRGLYVDQVSA